MRCSRRDLLKRGLLLPAALLPTGLLPGPLAPASLPSPAANVLYGEDVILAHISDIHVQAGHETEIVALRALLARIRAINPALLIDTGDITEDSAEASYKAYLQAYADVGGFAAPPDYGPGIPVYVVAGNHEYCGLPGYGYQENLGAVSYKHNLVVGNYRLVGTSGNADWAPDAWPAAFLNGQMTKSCSDGKPLVFFHHFCPHGWVLRANSMLQITPTGWATINALAQRYPVLAYLCGHCHYDKTEIEPPGYFVHAVAPAGGGGLALHALSDGHINTNSAPGEQTHVLITRPAQFMEGLDHDGAPAALAHTQTLAQQTLVRAYVRASQGHVVRVTYRLNDGAAVAMQRLGETSYWEASLDARGLAGRHTLSVTATSSLGAWALGTHQIVCTFARHVPPRVAPACASQTSTLSLAAGWNLISLPFVPLHPAPPDTLAPIAGQYTQIITQTAPDPPAWEIYSPKAPAFVNSLTALLPQRAYWLRLEAPAELPLLGNPLSPAAIELRAGWNMVGYPSLVPQPIATALAGIAGNFDCVYAYDATTPGAPWRVYAPDASPPLDEIETLRPGSGYWIHALADCTWLVP